MVAHQPHPILAKHFDRWLTLGRETCAPELNEANGAMMLEYAQHIGRSFKLWLGLHERAHNFFVPVVGITRQ